MEVFLSLSLFFPPHKYSHQADLNSCLNQYEQVHWKVVVLCPLVANVAVAARGRRAHAIYIYIYLFIYNVIK